MATGRILYFKSSERYPGSWFGTIVDDAIGHAHPSTDVYFDERALPSDIDRSLITAGLRVEFKYNPAMDSEKRLCAATVAIVDDLDTFETGHVMFITPSKERPGAFYGFIRPDEGGASVWFGNRFVRGDASRIGAGTSVQFRRVPNAPKPRAAWIKEIEHEPAS